MPTPLCFRGSCCVADAGRPLLPSPQDEDFPAWYSQVITRAELIEYYTVSGCYILRPWAYRMWEGVQVRRLRLGPVSRWPASDSYFSLVVCFCFFFFFFFFSSCLRGLRRSFSTTKSRNSALSRRTSPCL